MTASRETTRARVAGVPVDLLTMAQTVEACRRLIEAREPAQHVVVNAAKAVCAADDAALRTLIESAAIVNADGQSVVWAGRVCGVKVPERVTGIDLMSGLLSLAEREQYPVFMLGATPEALAGAVRRVKREYPGCPIVGTHHGYFDDDARVAQIVRDSGARLLFVAMPSPRKESFVARNRETLGPLLAVGVGGSFDVLAGQVRRAPLWMQRTGLEWFYRFVQEPRKMWRRYLVGNARFVALALRHRAQEPDGSLGLSG
jgi:N-acetylglucosaminyldiphosphoundecaprenol N-acetyl-beta-D-mannosaminyltransferase